MGYIYYYDVTIGRPALRLRHCSSSYVVNMSSFKRSVLLLILLVSLQYCYSTSHHHDNTLSHHDTVQPCIADLDSDNMKARIFNPSQNLDYEMTVSLTAKHFLPNFAVLDILQFVVQNNSVLDLSVKELFISLYDAERAEEECNHTTSLPVIANYVASTRQHHVSLGPAAWDLLTLGAMDTSNRANRSIISLPAPPCMGSELEKRIYSRAFQMVRVLCVCTQGLGLFHIGLHTQSSSLLARCVVCGSYTYVYSIVSPISK